LATGLPFRSPEYYQNSLKSKVKKRSQHNIWVVFIDIAQSIVHNKGFVMQKTYAPEQYEKSKEEF